MKVKLCGIVRPEDLAAADAAGADYLGIVLVPGSKRYVSEAALRRLAAVPVRARRVGVFGRGLVGAVFGGRLYGLALGRNVGRRALFGADGRAEREQSQQHYQAQQRAHADLGQNIAFHIAHLLKRAPD